MVKNAAVANCAHTSTKLLSSLCRYGRIENLRLFTRYVCRFEFWQETVPVLIAQHRVLHWWECLCVFDGMSAEICGSCVHICRPEHVYLHGSPTQRASNLGQLPLDHHGLDVINGMNILHAVDNDPANLHRQTIKAEVRGWRQVSSMILKFCLL